MCEFGLAHLFNQTIRFEGTLVVAGMATGKAFIGQLVWRVSSRQVPTRWVVLRIGLFVSTAAAGPFVDLPVDLRKRMGKEYGERCKD